jgi:sporulation protein YlmC with PRC-barrel domain
MKSKFPILSSSILAVCTVLPSVGWTAAPVSDMPQKGHSEWAKRTNTLRKAPLGPISRAADLIGREVRNKQNEKLGKIEDLAIDTDSGRITQVIVTSGGLLGIGDRLTAVPPSAFEKTADVDPMRLDVSRDFFKGAPGFNAERWDEFSDANAVTRAYRYFKTEPYFIVSADRTVPAREGQPHLGHLVSAKRLVGMSVKNAAGDTIGDVKDLLVDFHAGRVNQVLVSTGGFLGVADEVSVVPPGAFRFSNQDKHLVLDVSKETLMNSPRFRPDKWTESQETSFIARVYEAYKVEPYFDANAPIVWHEADNSARNRDRNAKTAENQGNSQSDIEITRDIRKAIIAKDGFSMNAQNVKIITENGEVTLKGPVNSQWEKKEIEDLAASVVDRSKVDNQLEVKSSVVSR